MNCREKLARKSYFFCGAFCGFLFGVLYAEQPGITTWMVATMTLFLYERLVVGLWKLLEVKASVENDH